MISKQPFDEWKSIYGELFSKTSTTIVDAAFHRHLPAVVVLYQKVIELHVLQFNILPPLMWILKAVSNGIFAVTYFQGGDLFTAAATVNVNLSLAEEILYPPFKMASIDQATRLAFHSKSHILFAFGGQTVCKIGSLSFSYSHKMFDNSFRYCRPQTQGTCLKW